MRAAGDIVHACALCTHSGAPRYPFFFILAHKMAARAHAIRRVRRCSVFPSEKDIHVPSQWRRVASTEGWRRRRRRRLGSEDKKAQERRPFAWLIPTESRAITSRHYDTVGPSRHWRALLQFASFFSRFNWDDSAPSRWSLSFYLMKESLLVGEGLESWCAPWCSSPLLMISFAL